MAERDLLALCDRIARKILTNGAGERALRVILVREDLAGQARLTDPSRDLGGRSEDSLSDLIADELRAAREVAG